MVMFCVSMVTVESHDDDVIRRCVWWLPVHIWLLADGSGHM